jgi:NADH:ubiquinone oxidoreductase subunit 4 (subunit M)
MPLCILVSWNSFTFVLNGFLFTCIDWIFVDNVFLSLDVILFYIFFESLLIPLFLLISDGVLVRDVYTPLLCFFLYISRFFIYVIRYYFLIFTYGTTNLYILNYITISNYRQLVLWLAFFFSFGTKIPMIPFIFGYLKLM